MRGRAPSSWWYRRTLLFVAAALVVVVGVVLGSSSGDNLQREMLLANESGSRLDLFWINPGSGEKALLSNPFIDPETVFSMSTYVGHRFQVREHQSNDNKGCAGRDGTCRANYLTVKENRTYVRIDRDFQIHYDNHKAEKPRGASEAVDMTIDECHARAVEVAQRHKDAAWLTADAVRLLDEVVDCVRPDVADRLGAANEELAFHAQVRTGMGEALENYTCADENLIPTEPSEVRSWEHGGKERRVNVMIDRQASKIHVVDDFVEPEECAAMEKQAAPMLHAATVADTNGGSRLSETRKAMQAGIKVNWSREQGGDPVAVLSRRVFDYTNHATGLNLKEHGQEDLMSIQYFGRGEGEKAPDRYLPHCDGDCDGTNHKQGTRVATMVMYCDVAEKGGMTNFRNSHVNVRARKGSAVFFSYVNVDEKIMDKGFTEHSGCPVIHGEKRIVTQWMRLGVDSQSPWDAFNTLGVKITDTLND